MSVEKNITKKNSLKVAPKNARFLGQLFRSFIR